MGFPAEFQNCIAHFVALAADKMLALGSRGGAGIQSRLTAARQETICQTMI
jgi:hypothetical protein